MFDPHKTRMIVIRQPGFDLLWQQWSLLNCFCTVQGHCGACRRKWRLTDTDLCPCGETQTMSHIVESCPLTKLNGGLSRLHFADEDTVSWLTSGSWHAYGKKKKKIGLPCGEEIMTLRWAVSIQHRNVMDGQTDRQNFYIDIARQHFAIKMNASEMVSHCL